jgi:tRNA(fMet)-specific endonuclease VapC
VNPQYLLDTNVLSEPVRPVPDGNVLERLREHSDEIATAAVVWHELQFGVRRLPESGRRRTLQRYLEKVVLASVPILPYDAEAAAWHAAQRARLIAFGKTPAFPDGMIAATAHVNRLILVTRNVTDFVGFEGLNVESWHG